MANLNEKICIIGGGPAGLSAAMYLEQKGYTNYAILEKEDHVGRRKVPFPALQRKKI